MAVYAREEANKRPETLTLIPYERWPANYRQSTNAPMAAWESRKYLVQMYKAPDFKDIDARRLSICRVTLKGDGRWEENLTWEELMTVKRECGYSDWYAIEIYPRDRDIVNVANLRHLWMFDKPLPVGWFVDEMTSMQRDSK
jgi:hypothetical protein